MKNKNLPLVYFEKLSKKKQEESLKIVKKYSKMMKEFGACDQCSYPWKDGICECDDFLEDKIAKMGYVLIMNGVDIN